MTTKIIHDRNPMIAGLILLLHLIVSGSVDSRQFRQIIPIAGPQRVDAVLPDGAVQLATPTPVPREQVQQAIEQVVSNWNTNDLEQVLGEEFFDKSRLTDAINVQVPRDATLRVQAIQGVQTLQQYQLPESAESPGATVSIVSATVRTQLEFNDPQAGFVRRPGVNEFILKITQGSSAP
jgi:hypothetical protein